jgi:aminomethyltransferase
MVLKFLCRALKPNSLLAPCSIGLGARNSLRLEAGLCLYGNDIDTSTNPVEAALTWAVQKVRKAGGERESGFPGASELIAFSAMNTRAEGLKPLKKRVGLMALERIPVRDGTELVSMDGAPVGKVTSGLLGPTINQPIAMAYVSTEFAVPDSVVHAPALLPWKLIGVRTQLISISIEFLGEMT